MKVIERNISELIPAEYNPRYISDEALEHLKASIQRFDAVEPVLVNVHPDRKNIIISGHQRLKAAKALGMKKFPCVELELDADKERELNIRMNKNTGTWDWDELSTYFDTEELTEWGFTDEELFGNFEEEESEAEEDDYKVPDEIETDFVLGDLIEIGEHRLLCGDSTDSDQVAKLMNGEKADMVFTDPPYGIRLNYVGVMANNTNGKIENDDVDFDPSFILSIPAKAHYFFGVDYYIEKMPNRGNLNIWAKAHSEKENDVFGASFETFWRSHKSSRDIWFIKRINALPENMHVHPTQKPIALIERAINDSDTTGMILDLYLGSGSTMVACHQLNRKCCGMELDPKYCQVIVDRMKELDPSLEVKVNGDKYVV